MSRRPPPPPLRLFPLLQLLATLLYAITRLSDAQTQALPTTGPSPYLVAPTPPTGTFSAGDLSSSQPYLRDPNQIGVSFPAAGGERGPTQGVSPPVGGNGTDPSASPSPSNGTSPTNGTAPVNNGNNNSALTRGAQLILPAAVPLSVDPFSAMTLGVASALLPSLLAAKAAEVANAAAAKVLVGEQQKMKEKNKKKTKVSEMCPLSPEDRDLLRTVTGAALGAGASSLAGRATPLELGRCALTLKSTKPAAFQWVVLSGGRVNLCTILLGDVSSAITQGIVEGKCYTPPETTAATSVAAVGGGG